MTIRFSHKLLAPALVVAAGAVVASCTSSTSPPRQVEATNPSVTYKYRGDRELVNATRRAETYCANFGMAPRIVNVTDDPDGSSSVVFGCDRTAVATVQPVPGAPVTTAPAVPPRQPSVSYTYRSDSQLVDATGTASAYCRNYNGRPEVATITTNADGTKTVVFDCTP